MNNSSDLLLISQIIKTSRIKIQIVILVKTVDISSSNKIMLITITRRVETIAYLA